MQYIRKQNKPPESWEEWFTTATNRRTFDYNADSSALTRLPEAKQYLIDEQNGLCAYCQQSIQKENASIEHVIPKEYNIELSTCYYNLVAVCKSPPKDTNGRLHCDKEKGSKLVTSFIFASNSDVSESQNNGYFTTAGNGSINSKKSLSPDLKNQADAFISILNLNHSTLVGNRNEVLNGILAIYLATPHEQRRSFLDSQFNRLLLNPSHPFRQFLLIMIGKMRGLN